MRTYDPADRIRYVHLPVEGAAPSAPRPADPCDRLPAGYANQQLLERLAAPAGGPGRSRPALVVLPGGAQTTTGPAPSPAAPSLRLA